MTVPCVNCEKSMVLLVVALAAMIAARSEPAAPRMPVSGVLNSWLTAAAIPYRMQLATALVKAGNLEPLTSVPKSKMVQAAADWLGVAQWSLRTERALNLAVSDPSQLALLALNAPEYVVNA